MCKVYLYSRVSTSAQTLAQQERTAYEWLKAHNMNVDEVVSDEGISGGVSYKERNLGKILLPKMVEGDLLIVSEISRLGRSMFNLSELIHKELKPRKIRLVCVNMSIDLNCAKMTAIDELIISNFSFAAQLEKQLISERTLSALQVKRKQGVKFGAAAQKYKETYYSKSKEERKELDMKRGKLKTIRHLESRDSKAFIRVLKNVFPEYTEGDVEHWKWGRINCKVENRLKMLTLMEDYRSLDESGCLFRKWDFSDDKACKIKLNSYMQAFRKSVLNKKYNA